MSGVPGIFAEGVDQFKRNIFTEPVSEREAKLSRGKHLESNRRPDVK
jgi:hypothetical protein